MTKSSRFRALSDEQWSQIAPLLPSNAGRRGRPFGEDRRVVEGIVYRYRTGVPWRDLPREEFGPWRTVWKRHRRCAGDGTWDRVLATLLADVRVPRLGPGRPRTRPDAVIADKAYSTGVIRRALRARKIKAVIPEKSDHDAARRRRGRHGGRPPHLDTDAYKTRNVVERSFALTKQWRGLATRYDKLAITYRPPSSCLPASPGPGY